MTKKDQIIEVLQGKINALRSLVHCAQNSCSPRALQMSRTSVICGSPATPNEFQYDNFTKIAPLPTVPSMNPRLSTSDSGLFRMKDEKLWTEKKVDIEKDAMANKMAELVMENATKSPVTSNKYKSLHHPVDHRNMHSAHPMSRKRAVSLIRPSSNNWNRNRSMVNQEFLPRAMSTKSVPFGSVPDLTLSPNSGMSESSIGTANSMRSYNFNSSMGTPTLSMDSDDLSSDQSSK